jgi:serine protease Do
MGIGFAIPINMAKDLLPQLKKGEVVRGWLGVMIQSITSALKDKLNLEDENGALVADVVSGGPADKAGIQRGDVIVSFDGKEVKEMKELPYLVASTPVGKTVEVEVIRKGKQVNLQVKIEKLKESKTLQTDSQAEPNLGMIVKEITPELAKNMGLSDTRGLVVIQVESNSPAAEAGLLQGDIILEMDQVPLKDLEEFHSRIGAYKEGDTVLFLVKRKSATLYLTVKVRE